MLCEPEWLLKMAQTQRVVEMLPNLLVPSVSRDATVVDICKYI